jgi:enoyl-CoA hydratase
VTSATSWYDLERDGGVSHLRLNRPDAFNSLLPAFWTELPAVIADLDDGRTRALVISSTGKHFCAGLDLSVFAGEGGLFGDDAREPGRRRAQTYAGIRLFQTAFTALAQARFPVLAAIQGGCIGGGLGIASACDLRYATTDAFFVLGETNIGITADVGQLQRLPRVMPDAIVRELAYRGHRLPAARAEQIGFLNGTYADHATLVDGVLGIAAEVAGHSPLAVWGAKTAIDYAHEHSVADGLDQIALWQAAMYHRTDSAEAMTAKAEGRAPAYDDLP